MDHTLTLFFDLRSVFIETEVHVDFALPRQHALLHYIYGIQLFRSPYGLCSSITESNHITTVNDAWRSTNKDNPLLRIQQINMRMAKMGAARAEYGRRGMLSVTLQGQLAADVDGDDDRGVAADDAEYSALVVSVHNKSGMLLILYIPIGNLSPRCQLSSWELDRR